MRYRTLLIAVSLSGCMPSLPSNAELTRRTIESNEKMAETDPNADMRAYGRAGADCARKYEVTFHETDKDTKTPWAVCVREFAKSKMTELRASAAAEHDPVKRDETLRRVACIDRMAQNWNVLPFKSLDDCEAHIAIAVEDREAIASNEDYAAAEKTGTPEAWIAFLGRHPGDKRSEAVSGRVLADAKPDLDEALVKAYPPALQQLPAPRRLLLVGPKDLRVRDLKKMVDAKVATSILVARVRSVKEPYKNFEGEELAALKQLGIPDEAVTAMIEVSSKLEDKQKADEERKAMRAEIDSLRKLVEDKKNDATAGAVVQTKDGPMDALASCAKRLAAMKLCDQLPSPGSTICKSSTESEFPCPQQ